MKKFIPLLTILGVSTALFSGCNISVAKTGDNTLEENLKTFQSQVDEYSTAHNSGIQKTILNKYSLTFPLNDSILSSSEEKPINDNLNDGIATLPYFDEETKLELEKEKNNQTNNNSSMDIASNIDSNKTITPLENATNNEINNSLTDNTTSIDNNNNLDDSIEIPNDNLNDTNNTANNETNENLNNPDNNSNNSTLEDENEINENTLDSISTLYSISSDIDANCEDFCELKDNIADAIIETQNLITKLQNKEIELTPEQKLFVSMQSNQLKSLSKQLSKITSELNFNLSDVADIMRSENGQVDNLTLKYLVILDNLINGNDMLRNGLSSLNMINHIFNSDMIVPPNNSGRILYGFKTNNNDPIIRDYLIDNNVNIVENKTTDNDSVQNNETNESNLNNTSNVNNSNIDTYQNNKLSSNIDTFYNKNYKNIDTFFNTAWLNNMKNYNGNYMNNYNNFDNPYANLPMGQPNYYPENPNARTNQDTTESVNNANNTQNSDNNRPIKQPRKKFNISKNIDTYRSENTPSLSTRFKNFKASIKKFFDKSTDKGIENPIHNLNKDDAHTNETIEKANKQ